MSQRPEGEITDREVIEAITELRGDIRRVEEKIDSWSTTHELAAEAYTLARETQYEQGYLNSQVGVLWWGSGVIFVAVIGLIFRTVGKKEN